MSGGPPLFRDNVPLIEVGKLKVAQLLLLDHQGWNMRTIHRLFEPASARHIKSIELPFSSAISDLQFWCFTKSGQYSTQSGYDVLLHQQNEIYSMTSHFDAEFFRIL